MASLFVAHSAAAARSVAVTIQGAAEPWVEASARRAAAARFEKLGYQIVEAGAPADTQVMVSVEKAYSHPMVTLCSFAHLF